MGKGCILKDRDARLLIGQIFARRLPPAAENLDLERFPVSNYIVFKDALGQSLEDAGTSLGDARKRLRENGVEPLFMMDEEGGRVTQISGFFPSAPSAAAVARALAPDQARTLYRGLSEFLGALGIDVNLAPCVDVITEPLNPIIGARAFGETHKVVEAYGEAFIQASEPHTACVAKHFPGHGMTLVDSHLDMPTVKTSRSDLESIHIPPFARAIRSGASGVMVSHCRYVAIQPDVLPASISKHVVHDLLRARLRFDGLVITDSLDMDAVTRNIGSADAARAGFNAGADILLFTEDTKRFEEAFEGLVADLLAGAIDPARLTESMARRHLLLDTLALRRQAYGGEAYEHYLELRNKVLASSVRIDDPGHLLPLRTDQWVCISSCGGLLEAAGRSVGGVKEIRDPSEAEDKRLILWLMEPLRLRHSIEDLCRMTDLAEVSVLATSYRSLADTLGASDVKIVTDDTSPDTLMRIMSEIIGGPPHPKS
jgi:beta-glucosidase-like glycosyl hydrolase